MPNNGDVSKSSARKAPILRQNDEFKKKKISVLGVMLTVILTIVLIMLGERIIFDLNRLANPVVQEEQKIEQPVSFKRVPAYPGLIYDRSALGISKTRVYYPKEEEGKYLGYKLLIHASFIVPVFLLTFLLYYLFNIRLKNENFKIVMWGYLVFAIWMVAHLIIEALSFIWQQFPGAGIYVVLVVLAVIFTFLAVFIQKKVSEHHQRA